MQNQIDDFASLRPGGLKFMAIHVLLMLMVILMACSKNYLAESSKGKAGYQDVSASPESRAADLLGRMTVDEKIGQMCQAERGALTQPGDINTYFLGSLLSGGGSAPSVNSPTTWAEMIDDFQVQALQTRLKIPLLYGVDAVHGHNNVYGAVIFPHNIGLGCTRNPGLVKEAARVTAIEMRATGAHWTFAPCIAVPRDERWGRTYEGFGETAELAEMMSLASVYGFQGEALDMRIDRLACAKHYIGDGGTSGGRDQGDAVLNESELRSIHLPGYISAVNAGVGSIMASFNSWNGQKLHGHRYLLTTVLKEELRFDGFIISDWAGIDQLPGDYRSDVLNAINAGIDMVMVPHNYQDFLLHLKDHVENGRISQERIDDAVSRILKVKFRLGLFENPFSSPSDLADFGGEGHRAVARQCVRESLVLLKNESQALPVTSDIKSIVVAGRNGHDLGAQCGGWSISWQGKRGNITVGTTIYHAVSRRAGSDVTVRYSENGSDITSGDLVIAVLGEDPYAEGAGDRTDLSLTAADQSLIENVSKTGATIIALLISGRPMIITDLLDDVDAFIAAWLPGTEGAGIADVLFGDYPPVGKLNHTWPRSMDQVPINQGEAAADPLFSYGFGLTY